MPANRVIRFARSRRGLLTAASTVLAAAALPATTPAPASAAIPILGRSQYDAAQLSGWYSSVGHQSQSTVPVTRLAQLFLDEGAREGVRGDIAFCQAMVETRWLTFPARRMPPTNNNFSGLGATDSGTSSNAFPDAVIGVRAQIQHLKGWSAAISADQLRRPLVDPRWFAFKPTGQIHDWDQLGDGRWASDPRYGSTILALYSRLVGQAGTPRPVPLFVVSAAPRFPGLVKPGSTGEEVRQVQQRLKARRWRITVSGTFDAKTEGIVRSFQGDKSLKVDGQVGPKTWAALWISPVT